MSNEVNLNYLEYDFENKKLYIVKDHQTVLLCWLKAFKEKLIGKNCTIYHIDQHPDFQFNDKNLKKSQDLLNMNEEEIKKFILDDLHHDHSEFIVNAMFSGLIKDGITFDYNGGSNYGESVAKVYGKNKKMEIYNS